MPVLVIEPYPQQGNKVWRNKWGKWIAQITILGERHKIGKYDTEDEALDAYWDMKEKVRQWKALRK